MSAGSPRAAAGDPGGGTAPDSVAGDGATGDGEGRDPERTPRPPALRVRRLPEKQRDDRAALLDLLDTALLAHVGVIDPAGGHPLVVPMAFARDGDRLLVHGSTASRAFKALAAGAPACVTVTLLDGLVLARSQFESSMHYRSAMVFGVFTALADDEKAAALATLSDRLLQGDRGARAPSVQESRATSVLALALDHWSLKVSDAPPEDAPEDVARPVWAGVVPLERRWGAPVDAPDLLPGLSAPDITAWPSGQG